MLRWEDRSRTDEYLHIIPVKYKNTRENRQLKALYTRTIFIYLHWIRARWLRSGAIFTYTEKNTRVIWWYFTPTPHGANYTDNESYMQPRPSVLYLYNIYNKSRGVALLSAPVEHKEFPFTFTYARAAPAAREREREKKIEKRIRPKYA